MPYPLPVVPPPDWSVQAMWMTYVPGEGIWPGFSNTVTLPEPLPDGGHTVAQEAFDCAVHRTSGVVVIGNCIATGGALG